MTDNEAESRGEPDAVDDPGGVRAEQSGAAATDDAGSGDDRDQSPTDDAAATDLDAVVDEVRERDPEAVAEELAALRERVDELEAERDEREAEIDDLEDRVRRTQAEFQNYKKRAEKRREQLEERATEDLVEQLLDVRDNLARALETDAEGEDAAADVREGVEATLRAFDQVLDAENVALVEPEPGDDVDPQRHEVMLRVDSDQPADTVAEVYRPGYEMGEKVLRPAQVTVSEGDGE